MRIGRIPAQKPMQIKIEKITCVSNHKSSRKVFRRQITVWLSERVYKSTSWLHDVLRVAILWWSSIPLERSDVEIPLSAPPLEWTAPQLHSAPRILSATLARSLHLLAATPDRFTIQEHCQPIKSPAGWKQPGDSSELIRLHESSLTKMTRVCVQTVQCAFE